MFTLAEKRTQALKIEESKAEKAYKAGLSYVICFWESPLSENTLCHSVGFFEDFNESLHFLKYMEKTYIELKMPFYIVGNLVTPCDGGLFDET